MPIPLTSRSAEFHRRDLQAQVGANTSYSGADIVASISIPGNKSMVFGELQTISYSIHREKHPVRALGRINPKGFTYGGRTIAGSMIFTVFDRHVVQNAILKELINSQTLDYGDLRHLSKVMVTDEMPPFDVTISFTNEYGHASRIALYGITIVDEGQVMSIDDIITENTMTYMARGIDLMASVDMMGNPNYGGGS